MAGRVSVMALVVTPTLVRAIQTVTGVPTKVVEAMTLCVYNGTALRLDSQSHRLDGAFPFGALSWSRYCPGCIGESQGRWKLIWRLGWSFACEVQNCLLADACPSCGKPQRRQQIYRLVPNPTMCACSHELAASPTLNLPAHH